MTLKRIYFDTKTFVILTFLVVSSNNNNKTVTGFVSRRRVVVDSSKIIQQFNENRNNRSSSSSRHQKQQFTAAIIRRRPIKNPLERQFVSSIHLSSTTSSSTSDLDGENVIISNEGGVVGTVGTLNGETKTNSIEDEQLTAPTPSVDERFIDNEKTTTSNLPAVVTTTTTTALLEIKKESDNIPSYRTLILFCSTTFLIWLSEPLLSLVDTTVVGLTQKNAVVQLASLGPATTLIDSMFYSTYFLAIATTNQIASQLAIKDYKQLQITTSHVLGVALVLGILLTTFVYLFARPIITKMAGLSGSVELIHFATKYSLIRASFAVSSLMGMTMQAICLATINTKTPSIAVLAASITNVIGDIVLRQYGVIGAAFATAASSLVSTSILFIAIRKTVKEWKTKELQQIEKQQQKQELQLPLPLLPISTTFEDAAGTKNENTVDNTNVNGLLKSSNSPGNGDSSSRTTTGTTIPFLSLPDRQSAFRLIKLSGPLLFVIVSKIICYSAMTIRVTDFGVESLAAHSIMMRIFFFYGCFGDSLSQTAQSFLPKTLYPIPNQKSFRAIIKRLLILAGTIGMINRLCTINILTHLGKYLTNDTMIIQLMKDQTFYIGLSILLHPFIVLLEGTVIASRNFTTLIKTYLTTLPMHFAILKLFCGSFPEVWRTFFIFQSTRFVLYGYRVWKKQANIIKEEKEALRLLGIQD